MLRRDHPASFEYPIPLQLFAARSRSAAISKIAKMAEPLPVILTAGAEFPQPSRNGFELGILPENDRLEVVRAERTGRLAERLSPSAPTKAWKLLILLDESGESQTAIQRPICGSRGHVKTRRTPPKPARFGRPASGYSLGSPP